MIRSKFFAGVVGVASLAMVGIASAEPTVLSASQMDSVTAAGGGGNSYAYGKKKHYKGGYYKNIQTNLSLQANVVGDIKVIDSTINGGIKIRQTNVSVQVNR